MRALQSSGCWINRQIIPPVFIIHGAKYGFTFPAGLSTTPPRVIHLVGNKSAMILFFFFVKGLLKLSAGTREDIARNNYTPTTFVYSIVSLFFFFAVVPGLVPSPWNCGQDVLCSEAFEARASCWMGDGLQQLFLYALGVKTRPDGSRITSYKFSLKNFVNGQSTSP